MIVYLAGGGEWNNVKLPQDPFPKSNYPTPATCIPSRASALKNLFASNLNFKSFREVNKVTARAGLHVARVG